MQYLLTALLIRTVNTYLYIAQTELMFTLGPTFSLFSILSAKTDANFPITRTKIQILDTETGLSLRVGTSPLCSAAPKKSFGAISNYTPDFENKDKIHPSSGSLAGILIGFSLAAPEQRAEDRKQKESGTNRPSNNPSVVHRSSGL